MSLMNSDVRSVNFPPVDELGTQQSIFGAIPVVRNEHVPKDTAYLLNLDYMPTALEALRTDWFGREPVMVPDPRRYRRLIHFLLGLPAPLMWRPTIHDDIRAHLNTPVNDEFWKHASAP